MTDLLFDIVLSHIYSMTAKFHNFYTVLDETADSKATVLKTLNILHNKFQIGIKLQYQVVVGDGKSYDHLIKFIVNQNHIFSKKYCEVISG
jgi:hypothetical protein